VLVSAQRDDLQRIVILNPKGGCGKTSLATNLASFFAVREPLPTLLDCDPQGGSMRWLESRANSRPAIHGIAAYRQSISTTRSWQLRIPQQTRRLIVDTPAALDSHEIHDVIYDANNILIPVLPSAIDIRYTARFIADLLLLAQLDRASVKVGIVANRTKQNTLALRQLMRFLNSLKIPVLAVLRDSQNFVTAAEQGIGICELPPYRAKVDVAEMSKIVSWLDRGCSVAQPVADDALVSQDLDMPIRPL
jgi:chromosome partitioning protein